LFPNIRHRLARISNSYAVLHKYAYGITFDPVTQFAVIFSAFIHDVEHHPGVPNAQLVNKSSNLARKYNNKSVAEPNSADTAWNLLMQPAYKDLRGCMFQSQSELD
jgi:hypothetical protein